MRRRHMVAGVLVALSVAGCTAPDNAPAVGGLISRKTISPGEDEIVVNGGGRSMRSLVLLPKGYGTGGTFPLLLAVHNFGGGTNAFAQLIHAARLTDAGILVVLPEAAGFIPEWRGPGISITAVVRQPDGRRVDDIAGLAATLEVVRQRYRVDPTDINVTGFSQGATVALALTRRLDLERPAAVRRLLLVAGGLSSPIGPEPLLEGTDLVAWQPGRNGMQGIANYLTGEPSERRFMPEIIKAKGCVSTGQDKTDGIDVFGYRCQDGRTLTWIYEARGEHAWPGQDRKFDSLLMGRGSRSKIDFSKLIIDAVTANSPSLRDRTP